MILPSEEAKSSSGEESRRPREKKKENGGTCESINQSSSPTHLNPTVKSNDVPSTSSSNNNTSQFSRNGSVKTGQESTDDEVCMSAGNKIEADKNQVTTQVNKASQKISKQDSEKVKTADPTEEESVKSSQNMNSNVITMEHHLDQSNQQTTNNQTCETVDCTSVETISPVPEVQPSSIAEQDNVFCDGGDHVVDTYKIIDPKQNFKIIEVLVLKQSPSGLTATTLNGEEISYADFMSHLNKSLLSKLIIEIVGDDCAYGIKTLAPEQLQSFAIEDQVQEASDEVIPNVVSEVLQLEEENLKIHHNKKTSPKGTSVSSSVKNSPQWHIIQDGDIIISVTELALPDSSDFSSSEDEDLVTAEEFPQVVKVNENISVSEDKGLATTEEFEFPHASEVTKVVSVSKDEGLVTAEENVFLQALKVTEIFYGSKDEIVATAEKVVFPHAPEVTKVVSASKDEGLITAEKLVFPHASEVTKVISASKDEGLPTAEENVFLQALKVTEVFSGSDDGGLATAEENVVLQALKVTEVSSGSKDDGGLATAKENVVLQAHEVSEVFSCSDDGDFVTAEEFVLPHASEDCVFLQALEITEYTPVSKDENLVTADVFPHAAEVNENISGSEDGDLVTAVEDVSPSSLGNASDCEIEELVSEGSSEYTTEFSSSEDEYHDAENLQQITQEKKSQNSNKSVSNTNLASLEATTKFSSNESENQNSEKQSQNLQGVDNDTKTLPEDPSKLSPSINENLVFGEKQKHFQDKETDKDNICAPQVKLVVHTESIITEAQPAESSSAVSIIEDETSCVKSNPPELIEKSGNVGEVCSKACTSKTNTFLGIKSSDLSTINLYSGLPTKKEKQILDQFMNHLSDIKIPESTEECVCTCCECKPRDVSEGTIAIPGPSQPSAWMKEDKIEYSQDVKGFVGYKGINALMSFIDGGGKKKKKCNKKLKSHSSEHQVEKYTGAQSSYTSNDGSEKEGGTSNTTDPQQNKSQVEVAKKEGKKSAVNNKVKGNEQLSTHGDSIQEEINCKNKDADLTQKITTTKSTEIIPVESPPQVNSTTVKTSATLQTSMVTPSKPKDSENKTCSKVEGDSTVVTTSTISTPSTTPSKPKDSELVLSQQVTASVQQECVSQAIKTDEKVVTKADPICDPSVAEEIKKFNAQKKASPVKYKKPINKPKPKKISPTVSPPVEVTENVEGYVGDKDLDYILKFIEGEETVHESVDSTNKQTEQVLNNVNKHLTYSQIYIAENIDVQDKLTPRLKLKHILSTQILEHGKNIYLAIVPKDQSNIMTHIPGKKRKKWIKKSTEPSFLFYITKDVYLLEQVTDILKTGGHTFLGFTSKSIEKLRKAGLVTFLVVEYKYKDLTDKTIEEEIKKITGVETVESTTDTLQVPKAETETTTSQYNKEVKELKMCKPPPQTQAAALHKEVKASKSNKSGTRFKGDKLPLRTEPPDLSELKTEPASKASEKSRELHGKNGNIKKDACVSKTKLSEKNIDKKIIQQIEYIETEHSNCKKLQKENAEILSNKIKPLSSNYEPTNSKNVCLETGEPKCVNKNPLTSKLFEKNNELSPVKIKSSSLQNSKGKTCDPKREINSATSEFNKSQVKATGQKMEESKSTAKNKEKKTAMSNREMSPAQSYPSSNFKALDNEVKNHQTTHCNSASTGKSSETVELKSEPVTCTPTIPVTNVEPVENTVKSLQPNPINYTEEVYVKPYKKYKHNDPKVPKSLTVKLQAEEFKKAKKKALKIVKPSWQHVRKKVEEKEKLEAMAKVEEVVPVPLPLPPMKGKHKGHKAYAVGKTILFERVGTAASKTSKRTVVSVQKPNPVTSVDDPVLTPKSAVPLPTISTISTTSSTASTDDTSGQELLPNLPPMEEKVIENKQRFCEEKGYSVVTKEGKIEKSSQISCESICTEKPVEAPVLKISECTAIVKPLIKLDVLIKKDMKVEDEKIPEEASNEMSKIVKKTKRGSRGGSTKKQRENKFRVNAFKYRMAAIPECKPKTQTIVSSVDKVLHSEQLDEMILQSTVENARHIWELESKPTCNQDSEISRTVDATDGLLTSTVCEVWDEDLNTEDIDSVLDYDQKIKSIWNYEEDNITSKQQQTEIIQEESTVPSFVHEVISTESHISSEKEISMSPSPPESENVENTQVSPPDQLKSVNQQPSQETESVLVQNQYIPLFQRNPEMRNTLVLPRGVSEIYDMWRQGEGSQKPCCSSFNNLWDFIVSHSSSSTYVDEVALEQDAETVPNMKPISKPKIHKNRWHKEIESRLQTLKSIENELENLKTLCDQKSDKDIQNKLSCFDIQIEKLKQSCKLLKDSILEVKTADDDLELDSINSVLEDCELVIENNIPEGSGERENLNCIPPPEFSPPLELYHSEIPSSEVARPKDKSPELSSDLSDQVAELSSKSGHNSVLVPNDNLPDTNLLVTKNAEGKIIKMIFSNLSPKAPPFEIPSSPSKLQSTVPTLETLKLRPKPTNASTLETPKSPQLRPDAPKFEMSKSYLEVSPSSLAKLTRVDSANANITSSESSLKPQLKEEKKGDCKEADTESLSAKQCVTPNTADMSSISELKTIFRSLLVSTQKNLTVEQLQRDFKSMEGRNIPLLGYKDLRSLLASMTDTVRLEWGSDNRGCYTTFVNLVVTEKIAHLDKLVLSQRRNVHMYGPARRPAIRTSLRSNGQASRFSSLGPPDRNMTQLRPDSSMPPPSRFDTSSRPSLPPPFHRPATTRMGRSPTRRSPTKQFEPNPNARSQEPSPNRRSNDPSPYRRSNDPSPNRRSRDTSLNRRSKDPSPNRRSKDPSPNRRSNDPSPYRRSHDPSPNRRSRDPSLNRRSRDTSPNRRSKDPSPNRRSKDPSPNRRSHDPSPNRRSKDPSPNRRSKDPSPNKRSKDPSPNRRSKDPSPNRQSITYYDQSASMQNVNTNSQYNTPNNNNIVQNPNHFDIQNYKSFLSQGNKGKENVYQPQQQYQQAGPNPYQYISALMANAGPPQIVSPPQMVPPPTVYPHDPSQVPIAASSVAESSQEKTKETAEVEKQKTTPIVVTESFAAPAGRPQNLIPKDIPLLGSNGAYDPRTQPKEKTISATTGRLDFAGSLKQISDFPPQNLYHAASSNQTDLSETERRRWERNAAVAAQPQAAQMAAVVAAKALSKAASAAASSAAAPIFARAITGRVGNEDKKRRSQSPHTAALSVQSAAVASDNATSIVSWDKSGTEASLPKKVSTPEVIPSQTIPSVENKLPGLPYFPPAEKSKYNFVNNTNNRITFNPPQAQSIQMQIYQHQIQQQMQQRFYQPNPYNVWPPPQPLYHNRQYVAQQTPTFTPFPHLSYHPQHPQQQFYPGYAPQQMYPGYHMYPNQHFYTTPNPNQLHQVHGENLYQNQVVNQMSQLNINKPNIAEVKINDVIEVRDTENQNESLEISNVVVDKEIENNNIEEEKPEVILKVDDNGPEDILDRRVEVGSDIQEDVESKSEEESLAETVVGATSLVTKQQENEPEAPFVSNYIVHDKTRQELRTLLKENPNGIWAADLLQTYKSRFRKELDVGSYGYSSTIELANNLPDIFQGKRPNQYSDFVLSDAHSSAIALHELQAPIDRVPETVKENVEKLLQKNPNGIKMTQFQKVYNEEFSEHLDPLNYGFKDINALLWVLYEKHVRLSYVQGEMSAFPLNNVCSSPPENQELLQDMDADESDFEAINAEIPEIAVRMGETLPDLVFPLNFISGQHVCIVSCEIFSPGHFYFHLSSKKYNKALDAMMLEMQTFYNDHCEALRVKNVHEGLFVTALVRGEWHRGRILTVESRDCKVFFVDYGSVHFLQMQEMCYLVVDFAELPPQAILGSLYNIKPPGGAQDWASKSSLRFVKLFENNITGAMVVAFDAEARKMEMNLVDTRGEEDLHINDLLVKEGLAEFINPPPPLAIEAAPASQPSTMLVPIKKEFPMEEDAEEPFIDIPPPPGYQEYNRLDTISAQVIFQQLVTRLGRDQVVQAFSSVIQSTTTTGPFPESPSSASSALPSPPPSLGNNVKVRRGRLDLSTSQPDMSTSRPDMSTSRPDMSTSRPDMSSTMPLSQLLEMSMRQNPKPPSVALKKKAQEATFESDSEGDVVLVDSTAQPLEVSTVIQRKYITEIDLARICMHLLNVNNTALLLTEQVARYIVNNPSVPDFLKRLTGLPIPFVTLRKQAHPELFRQLVQNQLEWVINSVKGKESVHLLPLTHLSSILKHLRFNSDSNAIMTDVRFYLENFNPEAACWILPKK